MTGDTDLDMRRRRIRVRAWRRGMLEMDLILGRFADAQLEGLDAADVDAFERLLDVDDDVAFRWFTGAEPTAQDHDTPLFEKIRAFHDAQAPVD
jgi:antitoxin CptB